MPDLRLTKIVVWKNRRVVKIGSPTKRVSPCPVTIKNDEHDISDTANSAKCSCRQNSSDGCSTVGMRSMPSGFALPSRIGQVRGLLVMPMLNCRFMMLSLLGRYAILTRRFTRRRIASMPHAPTVSSVAAACEDRSRVRGLQVKAARAIGALTMLACIGAVRFADAAEIRVYCTGAPSVAAKAIAA